MAFEFSENLTLYVPQIEKQVKTFTESATAESKKLIIELAAIHEGLTSNYNNYPAKALEASLATWVQPYAKPIILNHDQESEAVGRVMAARMDTEADGSPYIRLQVGITSPEAIAKCLDERYLTGSVGGKAESAKCSICQTEWATGGYSLPCKHERGKVYSGKVASLELDGLNWKEYSFVNIPADQKSSFRQIMLGASSEHTEDNDGGWIRPVSFYSVDMQKESIVELSESAEPRDVLVGMKKKEAHATYLNIKGTFLSASALDYSENSEEKSLIDETHTTINNESGEDMPTTQTSNEGTDMSQATETEETEDILAVTDAISADLVSREEEIESTESEETTESTEDKEEVTEGDTEETETTEGDEDKTTEEQLTDDKAEEVSGEQATESEEEENKTEEVVESSNANEELTAELENLKTENAKLRSALHRVLAERVVEAKIAVGMIEFDARADAITEHSTRSASSLADTLRDLQGVPSVLAKREPAKEMENRSTAVGNDDGHSEVTGSTSTEATSVNPAVALEEKMVSALMGRTRLNP